MACIIFYGKPADNRGVYNEEKANLKPQVGFPNS